VSDGDDVPFYGWVFDGGDEGGLIPGDADRRGGEQRVELQVGGGQRHNRAVVDRAWPVGGAAAHRDSADSSSSAQGHAHDVKGGGQRGAGGGREDRACERNRDQGDGEQRQQQEGLRGDHVDGGCHRGDGHGCVGEGHSRPAALPAGHFPGEVHARRRHANEEVDQEHVEAQGAEPQEEDVERRHENVKKRADGQESRNRRLRKNFVFVGQ